VPTRKKKRDDGVVDAAHVLSHPGQCRPRRVGFNCRGGVASVGIGSRAGEDVFWKERDMYAAWYLHRKMQ